MLDIVKAHAYGNDFLFVDAENPDGACHGAIEKLMDQIINNLPIFKKIIK